MKLIVGLGNPGVEYELTRHNAGFWALDALAEPLNAKWKAFKNGLLSLVTFGDSEKLLLFRPLNYMNNSGPAIREVVEFYKIQANQTLIMADDVYLSPGTARIRQTGTDGGHNGWKSILKELDNQFWRVRIGVGVYAQNVSLREIKPPLHDYVLRPLIKDEQEKVNMVIDRLVPTLLEWAEFDQLKEQTINL
jgi:PTH1 family peptidyl-tRNA hydrolase